MNPDWFIPDPGITRLTRVPDPDLNYLQHVQKNLRNFGRYRYRTGTVVPLKKKEESTNCYHFLRNFRMYFQLFMFFSSFFVWIWDRNKYFQIRIQEIDQSFSLYFSFMLRTGTGCAWSWLLRNTVHFFTIQYTKSLFLWQITDALLVLYLETDNRCLSSFIQKKPHSFWSPWVDVSKYKHGHRDFVSAGKY